MELTPLAVRPGIIAKKIAANMAPEMEAKVAKEGITMEADAVTADELGPYLLEVLK